MTSFSNHDPIRGRSYHLKPNSRAWPVIKRNMRKQEREAQKVETAEQLTEDDPEARLWFNILTNGEDDDVDYDTGEDPSMTINEKLAIISRCLYAECAFPLLAGHEVLACEGEEDWQGSARILAKRTTAEGFYEYLFLTWDWGSCEVCDDWQGRNLTAEQITEEMRRSLALFETKEQTIAFLRPTYQNGECSFTDWLQKEG